MGINSPILNPEYEYNTAVMHIRSLSKSAESIAPEVKPIRHLLNNWANQGWEFVQMDLSSDRMHRIFVFRRRLPP